MKKTTKALLMAACALALVLTTVMGTVAYLTNTATVENTFTVGKVEITMDEAPVNENGVADTEADRVTANKYKLMPGHTYDKDPIIHVDENSEDCWLFIKVENGIAAVEKTGETSIDAQLKAEGNWSVVDAANHVYAYKETVSKNANIDTFKTFTVDGEKTADDLKDLDGATINVTAYAVQADGFDTAEAAWAACGNELNPANP